MQKKIILIQVDSILGYPPTISLVHELINAGCQVTVLTTIVSNQLKEVLPPTVLLQKVGADYIYKRSPLNKFKELLLIRQELWAYIDSKYDDNTLLWVMSNITIKHMGMRLLKYRYNLHLFELVERVTYIGTHFTFGLDLCKLVHHAHRVIVCEYNRAHITRAWFRLPELPLVISNKPADSVIEKNSVITHSDFAKKQIELCEGKKIILYQGVVDAERPIEPIAKVIELLGDEYVFMVMTGSKCDYLRKYTNTIVLPYIAAPYHLEVTSHAYVGVLIYTPVYGSFTSPLNSIYCAPNKLYEYSKFGIPMIGNNIPGLKYTIENYNMGKCVEEFNPESFSETIREVSNKYTEFSYNARRFYDSDNKLEIVKKAIL